MSTQAHQIRPSDDATDWVLHDAPKPVHESQPAAVVVVADAAPEPTLYEQMFANVPPNPYLDEPEALEIPEFLRRQADEIMGVAPMKATKDAAAGVPFAAGIMKTMRHVSSMISSVGKPAPQPTVPKWRIDAVMKTGGEDKPSAEAAAAKAAKDDADLEIPAFLKRGSDKARTPE